MSVETPNTGFTPPIEDPMAHSGALNPDTWTPSAPVGIGGHPPEAPTSLPPQNFGRDYDPTHAYMQVSPGEVSPVAHTPSIPEQARPIDASPSPAEASPALSGVIKQNMYNLATSTSSEDVKRFGELLTRLTPGEAADYRAFSTTNDAAVVEARKEAIAAPQAPQSSLPEVTTAVNPEDQKEVRNLLLHGLKLRNPEEFKREFNALSHSEQDKFYAFEAREDARIKTNVPEAAHMVPKLSADGERFITPVPQAQAPQLLNTEAAAERYGATADFHPVAPLAPGQARDEFAALIPPRSTTVRGRLMQTIKGLPRKFTRRTGARR